MDSTTIEFHDNKINGQTQNVPISELVSGFLDWTKQDGNQYGMVDRAFIVFLGRDYQNPNGLKHFDRITDAQWDCFNQEYDRQRKEQPSK